MFCIANQKEAFFLPSYNETFCDTHLKGEVSQERSVVRLINPECSIYIYESSPVGLSTLTAKGMGALGRIMMTPTFDRQGPIWEEFEFGGDSDRFCRLTALMIGRPRYGRKYGKLFTAPSQSEGAGEQIIVLQRRAKFSSGELIKSI